MTNQRFNSFGVVFTFYVFFTLGAFFAIFFILSKSSFQSFMNYQAEAGGPASSSLSTNFSGKETITYGTEKNNGELGIKMIFDSSMGNKLNVTISYDTETTSATDFFRKQFTPHIFEKISKCGVINWSFMPCGTSKLDNGQLVCPKGEQQCKCDKIHACVATLLEQDPQKVGNFVICIFGINGDLNKCIGGTGLVQQDVDQCVLKNGANECNAFNEIIHSKESQEITGGSSGSGDSDGTFNFRQVLCRTLADAQLTCNPYCSPILK